VLRTDVDRPEQGFEKQCGIVFLDLWRVDTRAYERDPETSALELYFLVHNLEFVMKITLCDCAMSLLQSDVVKSMFQSRGRAASVVRRFQALGRNYRR
jgi:hypothetical protein